MTQVKIGTNMIDQVKSNVIKKINKILKVNIEDFIECEKVTLLKLLSQILSHIWVRFTDRLVII